MANTLAKSRIQKAKLGSLYESTGRLGIECSTQLKELWTYCRALGKMGF